MIKINDNYSEYLKKFLDNIQPEILEYNLSLVPKYREHFKEHLDKENSEVDKFLFLRKLLYFSLLNNLEKTQKILGTKEFGAHFAVSELAFHQFREFEKTIHESYFDISDKVQDMINKIFDQSVDPEQLGESAKTFANALNGSFEKILLDMSNLFTNCLLFNFLGNNKITNSHLEDIIKFHKNNSSPNVINIQDSNSESLEKWDLVNKIKIAAAELRSTGEKINQIKICSQMGKPLTTVRSQLEKYGLVFADIINSLS